MVEVAALILIVWFIAASGIPFLNGYFNDIKFRIDIHFLYIQPTCWPAPCCIAISR